MQPAISILIGQRIFIGYVRGDKTFSVVGFESVLSFNLFFFYGIVNLETFSD